VPVPLVSLRRWGRISREVASYGPLGAALLTVDHATIISCAQRRGARPSTFEGDEHSGLPLFEFGPDAPGLIEIGWDRFFQEFERADLAFTYLDAAPNGQLDDSHEFVKRATLPELTLAGKSTIVERVM
jgi:hypothetical protein